MAEFLTTKGIAAHIEDIIIDAKSNLFLISPYLQISPIYISRLIDASTRGVKTCIIYREEKLKTEEISLLSRIKGLEIRLEQDLHAKCYLNEQKLLIASMNFYEYSERNNIEMGVLLDSKTDEVAYYKAKQEADRIIKLSKPIPLIHAHKPLVESKSAATDAPSKSTKMESGQGHCIRCNHHINYDPRKPFCTECFYVWEQYGDSNYQEEFCHSCGHPGDTSKNHPECYTCYSAHRHSGKLMGRTG